jgi:Glucosamine 6-phosphate synthetase, contains amidotransferase and phosphosugar isomerase domains
MAEKMMSYLKEQPLIWRHLMENKGSITKDFVAAYTKNAVSQILVIASGSSYNAACAAAMSYQKHLGVRLVPVAPSRAMALLPLFPPENTLVFVVSQSGESTNTISLMDDLHQMGYRIVGLTQLETSTVAKKSDVFVHIDCGEESVGPKTKGYSSTVLCLQLLCFELAVSQKRLCPAAYEKELAKLAAVIALADSNISNAIAWAKRHIPTLKDAPHMMIVAEGENQPVMLEGALKILETLYIPVTTYEFEEYLHGVQCSIDENSHILFVIPNGPNRERMLRLYAFHEQHQGKGYIIALDKPTGIDGELVVLTGGEDLFATYSVVIPAQVISAVVSEAKGINCDRSKFPEFVKVLGTKNW